MIKALKKSALGRLLKRLLYGKPKPKGFPGSANYWEKRYAKQSNSGAGSYGRLAQFKAEILNEFVTTNNIQSVIEYGVGDGNQLKLATYPSYVGFDVSTTAIGLCETLFSQDKTKSFYLMSDEAHQEDMAELTLSLDVLYHLIEDTVFDAYMQRLFQTATRYVIIYSSNYDDHFAPHVKSRKFTSWIDKNLDDTWELSEHIKNKFPFEEEDPDNTSMSDFYIYKKRNTL